MPEEDWDPIRRVRASDKLWREFGQAASANGRKRSDLLRDYMRRYVAAWKGRQPKPHDGTSDTSR